MYLSNWVHFVALFVCLYLLQVSQILAQPAGNDAVRLMALNLVRVPVLMVKEGWPYLSIFFVVLLYLDFWLFRPLTGNIRSKIRLQSAIVAALMLAYALYNGLPVMLFVLITFLAGQYFKKKYFPDCAGDKKRNFTVHENVNGKSSYTSINARSMKPGCLFVHST